MNLALYLMAINVAAFAFYWLDKHNARQHGAARVPEYVLLLAGFAGGTVGAYAAQQMLRHKTKKRSFRIKFWLLTLVQAGLVLHPPMVLRAMLDRFFA